MHCYDVDYDANYLKGLHKSGVSKTSEKIKNENLT